MFYIFVYNDVDKAGADYVDYWPLDAPLTSIYFLSSDFGPIKIEGDKKSPCFTLSNYAFSHLRGLKCDLIELSNASCPGSIH